MTLFHVPPRRRSISFLGVSFDRPSPLILVENAATLRAQGLLASTFIPSFGGLYVIMVHDPTWSPLPYRPIYIGQAEELSERVCPSHEKYPSWIRAASGAYLYVAFCHIEDKGVRSDLERRLITHYSPSCNRTFNYNAARMRVLGDLA